MSKLRSLSWTELVKRLAGTSRDEAAWAEASQRLHRFARAAFSKLAALDADRPQEAAQRVLVKLHQAPQLLQHLLQLSSAEACQSYLQAMIYHAAVDVLRQQRRFTGPNPQGDRSYVGESPADAVERLDSAAELRRRLQSLLSADEWQLLQWKFWEGVSMQAVADKLGVPYHAAAMRLFRLQKKLTGLLTNSAPDY